MEEILPFSTNSFANQGALSRIAKKGTLIGMRCNNLTPKIGIASMKSLAFALLAFSITIAGNYFPLAVGNKWVFNDYNLNFPDSINRKFEMRVTDSLSINGSIYYVTTVALAGDTTPLELYYVGSHNGLITYHLDTLNLDTSILVFKHDYTNGEKWTNTYGHSFQSNFESQYVTVLDTFDSCFHVETNIDNDYVFACNVGMIAIIDNKSSTSYLIEDSIVGPSIRQEARGFGGRSPHVVDRPLMFDIHGRIVRNVVPGHNLPPNLPAGVYFLRQKGQLDGRNSLKRITLFK